MMWTQVGSSELMDYEKFPRFFKHVKVDKIK